MKRVELTTKIRTTIFALVVTSVVLAPVATPAAAPQQTPSTEVVLLPTNHPSVPADLSRLWFAPAAPAVLASTLEDFTRAVKLEVEGNFAKALPILSKPALHEGTLGFYAHYYKGLA